MTKGRKRIELAQISLRCLAIFDRREKGSILEINHLGTPRDLSELSAKVESRKKKSLLGKQTARQIRQSFTMEGLILMRKRLLIARTDRGLCIRLKPEEKQRHAAKKI